LEDYLYSPACLSSRLFPVPELEIVIKKGHQFDLVEGIQERIMKQLIISEMLGEMAT